MTKYTLFAHNGRLFHSETHYLLIGEWLEYKPDRVILQHGQLTEAELHQLRSQLLVNVYQHTSYHTVSITIPYDNKYYSRQPDPTQLTQYIGCLHRESDNLFCGRVHVK